MLKKVEGRPENLPNWNIEDNMLYKYRRYNLLDPFMDGELAWNQRNIENRYQINPTE